MLQHLQDSLQLLTTKTASVKHNSRARAVNSRMLADIGCTHLGTASLYSLLSISIAKQAETSSSTDTSFILNAWTQPLGPHNRLTSSFYVVATLGVSQSLLAGTHPPSSFKRRRFEIAATMQGLVDAATNFGTHLANIADVPIVANALVLEQLVQGQ